MSSPLSSGARLFKARQIERDANIRRQKDADRALLAAAAQWSARIDGDQPAGVNIVNWSNYELVVVVDYCSDKVISDITADFRDLGYCVDFRTQRNKYYLHVYDKDTFEFYKSIDPATQLFWREDVPDCASKWLDNDDFWLASKCLFGLWVLIMIVISAAN